MKLSIVAMDIAKQVFQLHGIDMEGQVVLRRQVRRGQVLGVFGKIDRTVVALEACATAHHWGRELAALGHEVRLIPPQHVKPYVKRGRKNDAADAEAICEAARRPGMCFVPVKSRESQAMLMLHRSRGLLVKQRTMLINAIRSHLAEFGIVTAKGPAKMGDLLRLIGDEHDDRLPAIARQALRPLAGQLDELGAEVRDLDKAILAAHRASAASRRLGEIPGIGPITASAIVASVPDPAMFASGRQFAAWLGLAPRQNSTGGKPRLGRITRQGDAYLRRLLIIGAQAVLRWAGDGKAGPWLAALLARRPKKVAAVALANKMARIVWAMLTSGEVYRRPVAAA
ncbi:MAG: IS110 family transposase [Burkholderiales bacterium]